MKLNSLNILLLGAVGGLTVGGVVGYHSNECNQLECVVEGELIQEDTGWGPEKESFYEVEGEQKCYLKIDETMVEEYGSKCKGE